MPPIALLPVALTAATGEHPGANDDNVQSRQSNFSDKYHAELSRRWLDRIVPVATHMGRYNGCHSWANNSDGSVLWMHLSMHLRTAASRALFENWRSFLLASHRSECFMLALYTREEADTISKPARYNTTEAMTPVRSQLSVIADALKTNFAWSIVRRQGQGPCGCRGKKLASSTRFFGGPDYVWPRCIDDWFVGAQLFGKHVALRHRIPMRPEDIILHTRPDVWWVAALDHSALHGWAVHRRQQLALFFNFESEGSASDVAYVHTRGVMERLCIDNFDAPGPGHPTRCPMCYGTAFSKQETEYSPEGPMPWSCGATANRLMLAASQLGAMTGMISAASGFGACISRLRFSPQAHDQCHFALNSVQGHWRARQCFPSPLRVCLPPVNVLRFLWLAYHAPPRGSNGSSLAQVSHIEGKQSRTGRVVPNACVHAWWLNGANHQGVHKRPRPLSTEHGTTVRLMGGWGGSHFYLSSRSVDVTLITN